ncbi:histone-lysine N-methyltransferase KMT5C-like [Aphis gossypii]|uniref:histone-lysine N-methyltransferase KMT5C-like n=1 Tax=Aphis gossypii TaxID=80765 RepID=UPI002158B173|nr:histone-lysine N-methyltransferase KMT5C-like [Aphis gossypii]
MDQGPSVSIFYLFVNCHFMGFFMFFVIQTRSAGQDSRQPPTSDMDHEARLLCIVDDMCTKDILDRHLGFVTHKTQEEPLATFSKKDIHYLNLQKTMYIDACAASSSFTIERCAMFEEDGDVGAKVMAAKHLKSGTVIRELCGRLVTVRESFLKPGRNDFSVVHSNYIKKSQLWLGPAAYANHDCESNCEIHYLRSGVACLRTNRPIPVGEEITAFYGDNYFGENNVHCLCTTCKEKVEGVYANTEPPLIEKPFLQCAHCPTRFRYKSWLVRHLLRHVQIDKFACGECGESFSRKSSLKRHAKRHDTELTKFQCTLCRKSFTRKEDATRHENTVHLKLSTHKCTDCELTFKTKKEMQYHHNRSHTGLKPFSYITGSDCRSCQSDYFFVAVVRFVD